MCSQQLADFEKHMAAFGTADIRVVAASAEPLKETREFVKKLNLSFQVGYGLEAKEFSAKTGAFYEAKDGYIHATGFILKPEGKVANAVYSTMAIGRLVAADCLGLIGHLKKSA